MLLHYVSSESKFTNLRNS
uniref:Uncharacterized protein n=1 Tax=Anguilla anguilla TaxID=7936 RepID=A0A0E9T1P0_ANGAN